MVIHGHVQPGAEHVLMMLSVDTRHDQCAVFRVLSGLILAELVGTELPSQLDLILDRAVLLEVPVEQVPASQIPAVKHL